MSTLLYTGFSFLSAFFLHFVVWKVCLPRRQTLALLGIFAGVLAVSIFVYLRSPGFVIFGAGPPKTLDEVLRFLLLYLALVCAYVVSYTAIEADSPSLMMISRIKEASGISRQELLKHMTNEILLIPRINDLVRDGLARLEKGHYKLTRKGAIFVSVFIFFRHCINAPKGG